VPVTGDRDDDSGRRPWHERTSIVIGASVAGLVVIGILFLVASYVTKEYNRPEQAPQSFVDEPSGSSSATYSYSSSATSTTEIITSTSPPVTTDINPGDETTTSSTSSTDTTSSGTSTSTTTTTTRRPPETTDDGPTTTRNRPRLNETRTLYPQP
jgi:cytoskeletal protein RodZ